MTSTATGHTTADIDSSPDVAAVAALTRAIVETTDVDTLMGSYAHDAVRIGPFTPGVYRGSAEIRADFEQRLAGVRNRTLDDIDLNIVTNGTYAVAHSQQQITETREDGTSVRTSPRSQDVFHKRGDGWVVVVQHTSFVADMAHLAGVTQTNFTKPGQLHWYDWEVPFPEPPLSLAQTEDELRAWMIDDIHAQVAEQALHFYGPGDYAVVYDSRTPPSRMVGMYDILQGWIPEMILKHVDDQLADYRTWTDGQLAAIFSLQEVVATKLDGTRLEEQIRQLDCLHRVDGVWCSFVESVSWPVDQKTGKVILAAAAQGTE